MLSLHDANIICEPGTEVVVINKTLSVCRYCKAGHFSRDGIKCLPCSTCIHGQTVERNCSSTLNVYCLCRKGTFLDERLNYCALCSDCPIGYLQTTSCDSNIDRTCKKCPEGQTTNGTNVKTCWTKPEKDTFVYVVWPAWAVAVTVLAVAFTFLMIAFLLNRCYKNQQRKSLQTAVAERSEENVPFGNGSDFEAAGCSGETSASDYSMSNVPGSVLCKLCEKLDTPIPNKKGWRRLAKSLGYSNEDIMNFQSPRGSATLRLISHYMVQNRLDARKLYNILKEMERGDAADLLSGYLCRETLTQ